jgi:hypothetical protein
MRTITKTFTLYNFDELNEDVKNTVINEYIDELSYLYSSDQLDETQDFVKEAFLEAELLRTPWFFGEIVLEKAKDKILERLTQREFLSDGTIFSED